MLKAYLSPAQFWRSAISSKSSSLVGTKRFCSVSSVWAFCREFKQLHQSYLAIFLSRQKVNFLWNWTKKNIEVWHSFGKWPHLHKLTFCVSVLLLIIKISQLARDKRFRYCKIRNYWYTKVGLNWLLKSLNASLTSTVNMAFVRRLISIPPPPPFHLPSPTNTHSQNMELHHTWKSAYCHFHPD